MSKPPMTIRAHIALCYANLARAHAALDRGAEEYATVDHMIKARLQRGLTEGTMKMGSLYDDERLKMTATQACYYCGDSKHLCVDHLIPKMRGGSDASDNLIWACRRCNSSKGGRDMLEWMESKGRFPPVLLLRRYVKIVARYCDEHGCLDHELSESGESMPFDVRKLPTRFPPLKELTLWTPPIVSE